MRRLLACSLAIASQGVLAQDNRFLEQEESENWTLQGRVSITAFQERPVDPDRQPEKDHWVWDQAAVIFPMIEDCASSRTIDRGIEGRLTFEGRKETEAHEWIRNYHSGARYAKWGLVEVDGGEFRLSFDMPAVCYNTVYNEEEANLVEWPKGDWPAEAKSTFQPQYYVDVDPVSGAVYDHGAIRKAIDRWCGGNDPKNVKPAVLAKYLAGEVVEGFQVSGNGLEGNRRGEFEGLDLMGAEMAFKRGRGSPFDMVSVLVCVYRQAGIPARMVIGYDVGAKDQDFLKQRRKRNGALLRPWVEFYLYDEKTRQGAWIPVDPVAMRSTSSRLPDLDREWRFFGTNDELNGVIPFAFGFHPQTTVRAFGSPGFWGMFALPQPPSRAIQSLNFQSIKTPRRSGDRDDDP